MQKVVAQASQGIGQGTDLVDVLQQGTARLRRFAAAPGNLNAEQFFYGLYPPREGGLRDIPLRCGICDRSRLDNGDHVIKCLQIHQFALYYANIA